MLSILYSRDHYDFLNEKSSEEIEFLRQEFSTFSIQELELQRPLLVKEKGLEFFTFNGTRVNRTIHFLFSIVGINSTIDEDRSVLELDDSINDFTSKWGKWEFSEEDLNLQIEEKLEKSPGLLSFSKWAEYLPTHFQVRLLKQNHLELERAREFLKRIMLVKNG